MKDDKIIYTVVDSFGKYETFQNLKAFIDSVCIYPQKPWREYGKANYKHKKSEPYELNGFTIRRVYETD